MTQESLDDLIDRVAGGLTAVDPDPGFAPRLRERLSTPRRAWLGPELAAAAAAAAVLVALLLMPRSPEPAADAVTEELVAHALAPLAAAPRAIAPADLGPPREPVRRVVPAPEQAIEIVELNVAPLDIAGVAEIAPLQVADLRVTDMELEIGKEPR